MITIQEWHVFTRLWMANVRQLGRDTNYCRLALAMRNSDEQRQDFEHYIRLAIQCKVHFDEMEDARLQRRKAAAEVRDWTFTFTGDGWRVEEPALLIQEPTFAKSWSVAGTVTVSRSSLAIAGRSCPRSLPASRPPCVERSWWTGRSLPPCTK